LTQCEEKIDAVPAAFVGLGSDPPLEKFLKTDVGFKLKRVNATPENLSELARLGADRWLARFEDGYVVDFKRSTRLRKIYAVVGAQPPLARKGIAVPSPGVLGSVVKNLSRRRSLLLRFFFEAKSKIFQNV
jgi:hypothetical protein